MHLRDQWLNPSRALRSVVMAVSFALVAVLGLLHAQLGRDFSLSVFYLLPIFLVAWFAGRSAGLLIAVPSALVWFVADSLTPSAAHPLAPYWNAGVTFAFFVVGTFVVWVLKQAFEKERHLARTDALTGVANSRSFLELAQCDILRAQRYDHPLTLAYMDIDNFKTVNDHCGHLAGDALLCEVVQALRETLRQTDVIARVGGDEFALLLPETGFAAAQVVSRKLQDRLQEFVRVNNWPITFSIGMVTCQHPAQHSYDDLIQRADELMYQAKNDGKNQTRHEVVPGDADELRQPA